jgi:hypothetical protein
MQLFFKERKIRKWASVSVYQLEDRLIRHQGRRGDGHRQEERYC